MKKSILVLALFALSSNLAHSEEGEPELTQASSEYVMNVIKMCKEYAVEDEISEEEMKGYMLTCVNDELTDAYYLPLSELPK